MFRKVRRITRTFLNDCYNVCFNHVEGYVLMLHRIGPRSSEYLESIEELRVSESRLQEFIDSRRKKYDFISLDDLYIRLTDGNTSKKKPFICITFDDGFKDNLTRGLPFFEKNHVPFAVFVTTGFIDKRPAFNFPFLLERIVHENDSLTLKGEHFSCLSQAEKNQVFKVLKERSLQLPYLSFEDSFKSLFGDYLKPEFYEDVLMSWEDVQRLSSSPLCTIGSHTVSHCRLSSIPNDSLIMELMNSKKRIEEIIKKPVEYLSYPFGWTSDVNEDVFQSADSMGYKMGFISHGGAIRKKDRNLFSLKREMLID